MKEKENNYSDFGNLISDGVGLATSFSASILFGRSH